MRQSICELTAPSERFAQRDVKNRLRLLVIGGSLGAVKLNEIIPQALATMAVADRPEVIHQTGMKNIDAAKDLYESADVDAKVEAFIDDMPAAYEWADLVICRSGAMTVFELAAAGVASVLVPYPYAVDDHQTGNARYLESAGAAIVRQQDELTTDWLVAVINDFSANRNKLLEMAVAARKLAIPDSAKTIADECQTAGGIA